MSTPQSNPVRTFDLKVVCAQGTFNPIFPTYVSVQIGGQRERTKASYGRKKSVWNETWSFAITTYIRDTRIKIQLYRVVPFKDDVLIGELEEDLLVCEPRNTDIVKSFEKKGKTCGYDVTFRIGETTFSDQRSRIQALVIGVDKYPKISPLSGCVNDALSMKALLSDRFHVPDAQIKLLVNKSATRKAILSYLETGFTSADCDAIVIYFAGHGSRIDTPPDWPSSDKKIETICPYNIGMKDRDTGETISGIEDYRFNVLLHKLAARKESNNITVILDSCHSAGASRDDDDDADGVRGVEIAGSIPKDWKEVLSTATRDAEVSIPRAFRYNYLASHVLLAACGQYEQAREVVDPKSKLPRGRFTMGLLEHLYEVSTNTVTNQGLIGLLPLWPNQHPQCVGDHSSRLLFDSKPVVTDTSSYILSVKDGGLEVHIGTVHGVVEGTEFTALLLDRPVLVATSVKMHSSLLALRAGGEYTFPPQTRLIVSKWNNDGVILKVFLSSNSDAFRFLRHDLPASPPHPVSTSEAESESAQKFMLATSRQTADIELTVTRSDKSTTEFLINRVDPVTSPVDPAQTVFKLEDSKLQYLPSILNRVSHFHFYLRNRNPAAPFKDEIDVQMFDLDAVGIPRTNLLIKNPWLDARPAIDGHVCVEEDRNRRYGFLLLNRSKHNIFPYLFYFDPRNYKVKVWHTPNEPIKAQSGASPTEMTVGYGAGGGFPFMFSVPNIPDVVSDTGFLKLFVSTESIHSLADIGQSDPLKPQDDGRDADRSAPMSGLWDTWTATITVKRPEVLKG